MSGSRGLDPSTAIGEPDPHHRQALAREFMARALYVAIVLLAALVALPKDRMPSDTSVVATMVGTAVGLIAVHLPSAWPRT